MNRILDRSFINIKCLLDYEEGGNEDIGEDDEDGKKIIYFLINFFLVK